jgi:DNA-binding SARP family transcriptional activator
MSSGVTFELLGPVRAWRDDTELRLGSPQQRALLAILLLARGRQVPTPALIEALWGDEEPKAAINMVRSYVSRLRRCLEPSPTASAGVLLCFIGDGYVLELRSAVLDVDLFERRLADARTARATGETAKAALLLRNALALWRGGALAGIPGPYAESRRIRLTETYLTTLEEKLALDVTTGDHATAIPELTTLLQDHPYREGAAALLMHALYKSSRQAEALAAYDTIRRRLREELGIDPSPALQVMHQRILQRDHALIATPSPVPPRPAIITALAEPSPSARRHLSLATPRVPVSTNGKTR